MKKLFATLLLLACVSVAFAGKTGGSDSIVRNPNGPVCHDESGKWNPENKNCDQNSCGCFFHQIEEYLTKLFG